MTGMLLFGTRMAYRPDLPAVRIDYIRVPGKDWVEDPDKRSLTNLDMRGPFLQIVDRAQAAVMDDLPKGFDLNQAVLKAGLVRAQAVGLAPQGMTVGEAVFYLEMTRVIRRA